MIRGLRLAAPALALMLATPAMAECADEVCGSLQKILAARSGNFAKLKGKPSVDTRGDAVWLGTQAIGSLISTCYVYKRGEGARYEYRCDSSAFGAQPQPAEKAKQIAADVKAAFQAADPAVVWFEDPASRALADVEGFKGTEGWYGRLRQEQSDGGSGRNHPLHRHWQCNDRDHFCKATDASRLEMICNRDVRGFRQFI